MGTAIYAGVTGLQAHQSKIDVIASNIANVNTTGYRSARALFQDLFSQTLETGRAPINNFGGTNSTQVGLGVKLGSVDTNFGQGALVTTGSSSDMAIEGAGFFVLSNGAAKFYTRDGSFTINSNGELVDPGTGLYVQGYLADSDGNIDVTSTVNNLSIPVGATSIVQATANTTVIGNLNSDADVGDTVTRTLVTYDSLGTERDVTLTFTKVAQVGGYNAWDWEASYNGSSVGTGTLQFNNDGSYHADTGHSVSISNAVIGGSASLPADPFTFDIDFEQVTELSSETDVTASNQDGFPRGTLESFSLGSDGIITGVFTNGLTKVLGQVAVATFSNEGGLVRTGSNLFLETPASGLAQIGLPDSGGRGTISGGVLENSNVDLGTEFSNLIVTQRGYQANTRTITTADTLLQETVNLVR